MLDTSHVHRPRKPQASQYYQCIEANLETLEQVYDERVESRYGFFRPYVKRVIYRYLDCGILPNGFARVRCEEGGHEFLPAFSGKRRPWCPSWHQRRVAEFGEWLCGEVLTEIPRRHFVFSIPKILRRYFLCGRKLLSDLCRCAWKALKELLQEDMPEKDAVPGADIVIHFRRFPRMASTPPSFVYGRPYLWKRHVRVALLFSSVYNILGST